MVCEGGGSDTLPADVVVNLRANAYPLCIYDGGSTPIWRNFISEMEEQATEMHRDPTVDMSDITMETLADDLIDVEMKRIGAVTDWEDLCDPLWFPSEESLVEFILRYG